MACCQRSCGARVGVLLALLAACRAVGATAARTSQAALEQRAGRRSVPVAGHQRLQGALSRKSRQPPFKGLAARLPSEVWRHVLALVPGPDLVVSSLGAGPIVWGHGGESRTLVGHRGAVLSASFFAAGDKVVTTDTTGEALVWCSVSARLLRRLPHSEGGAVFEARGFPDGDRLATIGADLTAAIWSVSSGRLLQRLHSSVFGLAFALRVFPSGDRIVTGVGFSTADVPAIWDVGSGRVKHTLQQPEGPPMQLELSPCGEKVVTASSTSVFIWEAVTGRLRSRLSDAVRILSGVAISAGAHTVAAGSLAGEVVVWDGVTGTVRARAPSPSGVLDVALLDEDRLVALSASEVMVLNASSGHTLQKLRSGGEVRRIAVSASRGVVATCGTPLWVLGQEAVVWKAAAAGRLQTISGGGLLDAFSDLWHGSRCSIAVASVPTWGDLVA